MVYDLSAHILSPGPGNRNLHSHHMVLSVIFFLVDNCAFLFQELPQEELLDKPTDEEIPKENKPVSVRFHPTYQELATRINQCNVGLLIERLSQYYMNHRVWKIIVDIYYSFWNKQL